LRGSIAVSLLSPYDAVADLYDGLSVSTRTHLYQSQHAATKNNTQQNNEAIMDTAKQPPEALLWKTF